MLVVVVVVDDIIIVLLLFELLFSILLLLLWVLCVNATASTNICWIILLLCDSDDLLL